MIQPQYMIKSLRFQKTYNLSRAQLIGQGNFAQVFKVFDEDLNKYIAIRKVIKSKEDIVDIQKERQINEELRKCSSPYILEIFQIIDGQNCIYYLTEYCQGQSLWHALDSLKTHKFSEDQTLKCILHIARGVQQLHNQRITHRDLKPQNILLTSKYVKGKQIPTLKIADFGLSTKNIIMQTVAGTKEYIAPEQAKFHTYTNAVDVWSLGIIFDQLLHGEPFYTGSDNKEVFDKILKIQYHVRNPNLSQPIQDLLVKIIKKKAYERPIIASIINQIEQILNGKDCKKEQRPRSQFHSRISQKTISTVGNTKNKCKEASIDGRRQSSPIREAKIPIFKVDKKMLNKNSKRKNDPLSKKYFNIEQISCEVQKYRYSLAEESLRFQKIEFNPNIKLRAVEYMNTLGSTFQQLKKQFQYLNQFCQDQTYQIKLSQTKYKIDKSNSQLEIRKKQIIKQLKNCFLDQIESYTEDIIMKSIS